MNADDYYYYIIIYTITGITRQLQRKIEGEIEEERDRVC